VTVVSSDDSAPVTVAEVLKARGEQLAQQWADLPLFRNVLTTGRDAAVSATRRLVESLAEVARNERLDDTSAPGFDRLRPYLAQMITGRTRAGATLLQITAEVSDLKNPLLDIIRHEPAGGDGAAAVAAVELMGTLRVVVMEIALSEGAEVIDRQRQQLLELSTPVIKLWHRVVAVPLIGTLDSARTQVVMETLLQAIVDQNAVIAILDITGVPMVDTVVAQYLLKTAMAVRLMGSECVISGIRPQIAQTIVQLGIDLGDITTRASLADALAWALEKSGVSVVGEV
jgi:rsbT co-antagonist protein RsbR